MNLYRRMTGSAVLFVALLFTSCGSDDSATNPTSTQEGTVAVVAMQALSALSSQFYLGTFTSVLGPQAPGPAQETCIDLPGCSAGTAQLCHEDNSSATATFTSCSVDGVDTDGTIVVSGTPINGSALLNLTIGDVEVVGSILYSLSQGCLTESFTSLFFGTNTLGITTNGQLRFCDLTPSSGVFVPDQGSISAQAVFSSGETYFLTIGVVEDGDPGDVYVGVYDDFADEVPIVACDGNLITGSLDCD